MRSKEEILNDFKVCSGDGESCKGCSYNIGGLCSDSDFNELDKEVIELLESDADYNKGMEDAWELIKKIYCMNPDDFCKCFDTYNFNKVIMEHTVLEVKTKIEEFERSKFCIGDIVYSGTSLNKDICGVIINMDKSWLEVLTDNRTLEQCLKEDMKKTGKHLDINSLFKQIEKLSE